MSKFMEEIELFIDEAIERRDLVLKYATQRLFDRVLTPVAKGGKMRADTGFLRASARVTLDNPVLELRENPTGNRPESERGIPIYTLDEGAINLTLNSAEWGQDIYMTFTANYAIPREYGACGDPGDFFVRGNTALWQEDVDWAVGVVKGNIDFDGN